MRKEALLLCICMAMTATQAFASAPAVQWTKTFEVGNAAIGYCVQQTTDGGFIVAGGGAMDSADTWLLIKTDSVGSVTWQTTLSATYSRGCACSVQQTADGGYVASGVGDVPGISMVKTDSAGNVQWHVVLDSGAIGYSVVQTGDHGYVATGAWGRHDTDYSAAATDSLGNRRWIRKYVMYSGEPIGPEAISLRQTADNGYIIGASTLIKIDSLGNQQWQKTYDSICNAYSTLQVGDRGYVATGAGQTGPSALQCFYLLRTDSLGNLRWRRNYTSADEGIGYWVEQAPNGGFVAAGWAGSESSQVYVVRTDSGGNVIWTKTLDGLGDARCVRRTLDGGYVVTGGLTDFQAGKSYLLLAKLAPEQ